MALLETQGGGRHAGALLHHLLASRIRIEHTMFHSIDVTRDE